MGRRHTSPLSADSWWKPRWLLRRQEEQELARWAAEVRWQWSDVVAVTQLAQHTTTAGRLYHTAVPQAHSVDPGPPVTLLVQMLPTQLVEDFQAQAQRIARGMGVSMLQIAPYGPGWIEVALLDHDPQHAAD
jgi:hypothetical protein